MKKKLYFLLLLSLAVVPSLISGFITFYLYNHPGIVNESNMLLFFLLSIFTMAFAITPTTFIAILSGYFFSWKGLIGIVIAYLFASVLGLTFGKILTKWDLKIASDSDNRLNKLLHQLDNRQFLFIVFARLSPVLPFAMTNVALSNLKIKWDKYLAGSLIGMFPRTFIFFYAGKNAGNIWEFIKNPSLEEGLNLIPVALILISTAGLFWVLQRSLKSSR